MATKPARDQTENWIQEHSTYFWTSADPFEAKFDMEKTVGLLLERDTTQTSRLTYSGSDNPPFIGRDVQLRFEAALPKGNWYSFRVTAWVPRTWYTESEFRQNADRAFGFWTRNLQSAESLGLLDGASEDLYGQRTHEAVEKEARIASQKEDQAPITAVKQQILADLRNGKSFRTVHHEGGTTIYFDGKTFVRSEYGEVESLKVLGSEDEALDSIRELYDWESRKSSFPHRPPELGVWEFIRGQLA
jgi:hypothetical protein